MKRTAAIVACMTFILAACGNDSKGSDGSVHDNFINACEATSGGRTTYCECMWGTFSETYTVAEFEEIDRTILEDGINGLDPADRRFLEDAAADCA